MDSAIARGLIDHAANSLTYLREIVVGIVVMVVGSYLVWALGIGTGEQRQASPASSMHDVEATTAATEYEEMVWQSERFVQNAQVPIAVLLENGKVIARRQVGVE